MFSSWLVSLVAPTGRVTQTVVFQAHLGPRHWLAPASAGTCPLERLTLAVCRVLRARPCASRGPLERQGFCGRCSFSQRSLVGPSGGCSGGCRRSSLGQRATAEETSSCHGRDGPEAGVAVRYQRSCGHLGAAGALDTLFLAKGRLPSTARSCGWRDAPGGPQPRAPPLGRSLALGSPAEQQVWGTPRWSPLWEPQGEKGARSQTVRRVPALHTGHGQGKVLVGSPASTHTVSRGWAEVRPARGCQVRAGQWQLELRGSRPRSPAAAGAVATAAGTRVQEGREDEGPHGQQDGAWLPGQRHGGHAQMCTAENRRSPHANAFCVSPDLPSRAARPSQSERPGSVMDVPLARQSSASEAACAWPALPLALCGPRDGTALWK